MAELNTKPLEDATRLLNESVELNRQAYRDMSAFVGKYDGEITQVVESLTGEAKATLDKSADARRAAADAILEAHRVMGDAEAVADEVKANTVAATTAADQAEEHAALASESEDLAREYADKVATAAVAALGAYGAAYDVAKGAEVDAERAELARDEVQSIKRELEIIREESDQVAKDARAAIVANTQEILELRTDIAEIRLQRVNDHADFTTKTAKLTTLVNEAVDKYFAKEA